MQHTHDSCAPATAHPLHDMWHEACTETTLTIFLYDLNFSSKHWMGEESYTLTLRTSQSRMYRERVNWTSGHRHYYYKDCWKIEERESTSQSKRKGVTKQHVTQISQRIKYQAHHTTPRNTQHTNTLHTNHTECSLRLIEMKRDRSEMREEREKE